MSLAIAVIVVAGLLIGATSIGGVLVVPALTEAAGLGLEEAIAAAMGGFLMVGVAALFLQPPGARLPRREAILLGLACLLGAAIGALFVEIVPETAIRLLIAALAILSGVHALLAGSRAEENGRRLDAPTWGGVGLLVGSGSALSGTSGPVLLMPVLLALRVPIRPAIALAQAIQLPIALSASGVHAVQGRLDLLLAVAVGCVLVGSTILGRRLALRIDALALKKAVAWGLIVFGLAYGYASL